MRRARCSCGRTIWRGQYHRLTGAGLAKYWVVSDNPTWRHCDDWSEACDPPGAYAQTGHLGSPDRWLWVVFLVLAIVLMLKALGVHW